jgi:hypothetical protein
MNLAQMNSSLDSITLRNTMRVHAICCIIVGIVCILLPHSVFSNESTYDHVAHEYIRLYGCLTLGLGWLVERCKTISDGSLIRIMSETFSICYALQCLVMIRAHFSYPAGHTAPYLHLITALIFGLVASLYGFVRLFRKAREFELPSQMRDE